MHASISALQSVVAAVAWGAHILFQLIALTQDGNIHIVGSAVQAMQHPVWDCGCIDTMLAIYTILLRHQVLLTSSARWQAAPPCCALYLLLHTKLA